MKDALLAIGELEQGMVELASTRSSPDFLPVFDEATNLMRSMRRKCQFATHHNNILTSMDWEAFEGIGSLDPITDTRKSLHLKLTSISLELTDREAAKNLILISFDGLVAACVNISDTLGRLINLTYELGITAEHASIVAVKNNLHAGCALAQGLDNNEDLAFLLDMRNLRGECQHADITTALSMPGVAFDSPGQEPVIAERFVQCCYDQDRRLSHFSPLAVHHTGALLTLVSGIIRSNPVAAVRVR